MRIRVTLPNILDYGLDVLTGKSRADLLATAEEFSNNGKVYYVHIPDVEGGDTEAPTERNVFEHHVSLPEPEGHSHKQESVNLTLEQEAYVKDPCSYKPNPQIDGSHIWICVKHGAISKHSVDAESHEPCEVVDPFND